MSLRTILTSTDSNYSIEMWASVYNELALDVGDLTTLTTSVKTSVVNAVNDIQSQVDAIVVGAFSLSNNVWFEAGLNGGGDGNVFRLNTSNNIEFGRDVEAINIIGGTISALTSPVPIAAGGTNANTASDARTSLGLAIGSDVQAFSSRLTNFSSMNPSDDSVLLGVGSDWTVSSKANFKTVFEIVTGTHIQAFSSRLTEISNISPANNTFIAGNGTAFVGRDATSTRLALGLEIGTNIQAWSNKLDNISAIVSPVNNSILMANNTGNWVEMIPVNARANLGLAIGTDIQAFSSHLSNIVSASKASGNMLAGNGTNFVSQTPAETRTSLGLVIGTNVQAYNSKLQEISSATATTGNMLVANGTNFVANTPSQVRTSLGLVIGTDIQAYNARLQDISGISASANEFIMGNGTNFIGVSGVNARNALGAQAQNARLSEIAGLTPTNNAVIIGNGSGFTTASGESLRQNIGAAQRGINADITALQQLSEVTGQNSVGFGWSNSGRLVGSGSDLYPLANNGVNLGKQGNAFNGVTAGTFASPANTALLIIGGNGGAAEIQFRNGGVHYWTMGTTGIFTPIADNFSDIGRNISRVKDMYIVNNPIVGSDKRIKKDIKDFSNKECYDIISKLSQKIYTKYGKKEVGLLAQDVYEVFPIPVYQGDTENFQEGEEGFISWGLKYEMLIPVLIGAFNHLNNKRK